MVALSLVQPTTAPPDRRQRPVDRLKPRLWAVGGNHAPMGAGVRGALRGRVDDWELHSVIVRRTTMRPDLAAIAIKKDDETLVMIAETVPDRLVMPIARHIVEDVHSRDVTMSGCSTTRGGDYCSLVWLLLVKQATV